MSETIEIKRENVFKAFEEANNKGRKLLQNLFGEKTFIKDIRERVKTVEDAFHVLGRVFDPNMAPILQAEVVTEALNEGWVANYANRDQKKWWIVWEWAGSGFRLRVVACERTYTYVGAPFVFKDKALGEYFATQFVDLANQYLTPKSK